MEDSYKKNSTRINTPLSTRSGSPVTEPRSTRADSVRPQPTLRERSSDTASPTKSAGSDRPAARSSKRPPVRSPVGLATPSGNAFGEESENQPLYADSKPDPQEPESTVREDVENGAAVSSAPPDESTAGVKSTDRRPDPVDSRSDTTSAPAKAPAVEIPLGGDRSAETLKAPPAYYPSIDLYGSERRRTRRVLLRTDDEPQRWSESTELFLAASNASEPPRSSGLKTLYSALVAAALICAGALAGAGLSQRRGAETTDVAENDAPLHGSQLDRAAQKTKSREETAPAASTASRLGITRIETIPAGAELVHQGAVGGNTPADIERPAFEAYRPRLVRIGPKSAATIRVTMEPIEPSEKKPPR